MSKAGDPGMTVQGKRALIVDNTSSAAIILKNILRQNGVSVEGICDSYQNAMREMRSRQFDLIYCDVSLTGGLSGQQLLRDARAAGILPSTTVFIFVSSEQQRDVVLGAIECEPDGYVIKPYRAKNLVTRTNRFLSRNHQMRSMLRALDEGDLQTAQSQAQELSLRNQKISPAIYNALARALLKANHYRDARHYFEKVLTVHEFHWARLGVAQCLMREGYVSQAQDVFEQVLSSHPFAVPAMDGLALCHVEQGDDEAALTLMQRAIKMSPLSLYRQQWTATHAEVIEQFDAARVCRKRAVELVARTEQDSPEVRAQYLRAARKSLENPDEEITEKEYAQRLSETFSQARQEMKNHPDHAELRLGYALLSAMKKNAGSDKGEPYNQKLLEDLCSHHCELLSGNTELRADVVAAFELSGDPHRAHSIEREIHTAAREKRKERLKDEACKGNYAYRKGKLEEALAHFYEIAAEHPEGVSANLNVAHVICQIAERDGTRGTDEAKSYLDTVRRNITPEHKDYRRFKAIRKVVTGGPGHRKESVVARPAQAVL